MATLTQEQLSRAQGGDLDAQSSIVSCFHREVRTLLAMLVGHVTEADDLAQETFLRAFDRLDRVHSPASMGGFLRGIARNVALEHLRGRAVEARRAEQIVQFMEDSVQEDEDEWWSDDPALTQALGHCMDDLPPRSRSVMEWRYREGYDATEIGARIDMRPDAVRAMLKRIRLALWQCIQQRMQPSVH